MDPLRQALCGAGGVVKTTRPTTYETVLKYARNKFAFHANFGVTYFKIIAVGYLLTEVTMMMAIQWKAIFKMYMRV